MNSIAVDKMDEYMGKMLKAQAEKQDKPIAKKKKVTKKQGRQQDKGEADDVSSDEIEVISDGLCSDNENDFSTLTSSYGMSYHPPSKHMTKSQYSKKSENDEDDIVQCIEHMCRMLEKQKCHIEKLTSKNDAAKEKLKVLHSHNATPALGTSGQMKQTSLKNFVSSQLGDTVDSLEEDRLEKQLDSINKDASSRFCQCSQKPVPYCQRVKRQ